MGAANGSIEGSLSCLACCAGDAATTEVFVVEGEPAVGVAGAVESIVVSVTDDDGTSNESEDTSTVSSSADVRSMNTMGAESTPFAGRIRGDCGGVRMSIADWIVSCGGCAREEIITPSAREGSRGRRDHMTKLLGGAEL